jgi:hypothetical protein
MMPAATVQVAGLTAPTRLEHLANRAAAGIQRRASLAHPVADHRSLKLGEPPNMPNKARH